jgi:hypothetical protein
MKGVVYALLVCPPIAVPPVGTVYHLYCPATPPNALSVMAADPQEEFPDVLGAVGIVLIVAVTDVLALSHVPLLMLT